jgi:hypothetical protein
VVSALEVTVGGGYRLAATVALVLAASLMGAAGAHGELVPGTARSYTLAGTSQDGLRGLGGPATFAALGIDGPHAVLAQHDGGVLIASPDANVVLRITPDGLLHRFAGTGRDRDRGDGGTALEADVAGPLALAEEPDGSVLIAEGDRVRRVGPDGIITAVAGPGPPNALGDGGPAARATFGLLSAVAALPDGGFVMADSHEQRLRRVQADGSIITIAGTGVAGMSGDAAPARAARIKLDDTSGVVVLRDGSLIFSDTGNDRVRRIAPDGTITTVAGGGTRASWRDGDPATVAKLNEPGPLAADPDGGFYLLEPYVQSLIDHVTTEGTISVAAGVAPAWTNAPLVGRGAGQVEGDGLLAPFMAIGAEGDGGVSGPGLGALPDGDLLLADPQALRVRELVADNPAFPAAAIFAAVARPDGASVTVRSSTAGKVEVRLLQDRRTIAVVRHPVTAGLTVIPIHRRLARGVLGVQLIGRFAGRAPVLAEGATVVGGLTTRLVLDALRRTTAAARFSTPTHRCVRMSPTRVDCEQGGPAFLGFGNGCEQVVSVGLDDHGSAIGSVYDCPRHGTFVRHPHFRDDERLQLLLFDSRTPLPHD